MKIEELRKQFESEYLGMMFFLERGITGEYISMSTFQAWGGYKVCAKANGLLDVGVDIFDEDAPAKAEQATNAQQAEGLKVAYVELQLRTKGAGQDTAHRAPIFNGKKLYDKKLTDKSENSVIWGTPPEIYDPINKEFNFTLDVCAIAENAKCKEYFTPEQDGLKQSWGDHVCWCNPPYGTSVVKWCKKALLEKQNGATTVLLIPCRTNTNWWHDYVIPYAEIRFLRGRVRFIQNGVQFKQALPFPLAFVVYRPESPVLGEESPAQNTMEICHTAPNSASPKAAQESLELGL